MYGEYKIAKQIAKIAFPPSGITDSIYPLQTLFIQILSNQCKSWKLWHECAHYLKLDEECWLMIGKSLFWAINYFGDCGQLCD